MWIFTRHGFYSAVCARQGQGEYHQPVDPERIMVRVRLRSHLEALRARFPNLVGDCEIQEFSGSDYPFRIFAAKSVWAKVVAELAMETDYDNFKGEVARFQGAKGVGRSAYMDALHEVWRTMGHIRGK